MKVKVHISPGGVRAVADVQPTAEAINVFRSFEGPRQWLKKGGYAFLPSGHNLNVLKKYKGFETEFINEGGADLPTEPPTLPSVNDYLFRTKPFPHQVRALSAMLKKRNFALFAEQGTGKTKVALDRAAMLFQSGEIGGLVVVAPKGVHRQWIETQAGEHLPVEFTGWHWQRGNPYFHEDDRIGLGIWAINYDGLKTPTGWKKTMEFVDSLKTGDNNPNFMLVMDESHFVKNVRSQRWKACHRLSRLDTCAYRLAMTGTPIAKNLIDEWAQLRIIDEGIIGIRYITAFRRMYCVMGGYEGREVVDHRNVDKFKALTAPHVFRARKDELGILPKMYSQFVFDMTSMQQKAYREMKNDLLTRIESGEIASAANAAVALLRLQQISNGFVVVDGEDGKPKSEQRFFNESEDNPRLAALEDVLRAEESVEPVIVWCRFRRDVLNVADALGEGNCALYYGGATEKEKRGALDSWLGEDGPRFFVATPGSGGTGLNLQGRCRHAIYYSNSENAIDRWQSEDRIHRIGTDKSVLYTDLIARGSRDRQILANLRRKKSLSDLTLDDIRQSLIEED